MTTAEENCGETIARQIKDSVSTFRGNLTSIYLSNNRESRHIILATLIYVMRSDMGLTYAEIAARYGLLGVEMIKSLATRRSYLSDKNCIELFEWLCEEIAIFYIGEHYKASIKYLYPNQLNLNLAQVGE